MLRIAICDDEEPIREYMSGIVHEWTMSRGLDHETRIFPSAESFLFEYEGNPTYDILLLDIEMSGMDGVTMARRIRERNDLIQIIFVTGYTEYIAEGYEVDALNYLVKPVSKDKMYSVLDKAYSKTRKNEKVLDLRTDGDIVRIPVSRVISASVYGNYVTIHADEDVKVKMTLGAFSDLLDDRFLRVGRSDIVNITKIRRVTKKEILMEDGSVIPLPRGAYETVNRAIIDFA